MGRRKRAARIAVAIATMALLERSGTAAPSVPLPPPRPVDAPAPVPLPPPRPPEQGPPAPPVMGPPKPAVTARQAAPPVAGLPPPEPATADEERTCAALFASGKVVARASEPVGGPGGCGMAAPVEVSAIVAGPGRRIGLAPPVEVTCRMGYTLADWVITDLVPAFDRAAIPLAELTGTGGYSCRSRDRIAGAKLSEHGLGEAVDIGGFLTAKSGTIGVTDAHAALLADVKRTACARFSTVLGPGSDAFHASHLHVDVAQRRNGFRICEWDLPPAAGGPALPRPGTGPGKAL